METNDSVGDGMRSKIYDYPNKQLQAAIQIMKDDFTEQYSKGDMYEKREISFDGMITCVYIHNHKIVMYLNSYFTTAD